MGPEAAENLKPPRTSAIKAADLHHLLQYFNTYASTYARHNYDDVCTFFALSRLLDFLSISVSLGFALPQLRRIQDNCTRLLARVRFKLVRRPCTDELRGRRTAGLLRFFGRQQAGPAVPVVSPRHCHPPSQPLALSLRQRAPHDRRRECTVLGLRIRCVPRSPSCVPHRCRTFPGWLHA